MNYKIDLGNNESASVGVFKENDGTFTVLTVRKAWNYKTEKAANKKWQQIVDNDLV